MNGAIRKVLNMVGFLKILLYVFMVIYAPLKVHSPAIIDVRRAERCVAVAKAYCCNLILALKGCYM
jgi:hypothetical protein